MSLNRRLRLVGALLALAAALMVWNVGRLEWRRWSDAERGQTAVEELTTALRAAEMVSREHGPTIGVLSDPAIDPAELVAAQAEARRRTDQAFDQLHAVLAADHDAAHAHGHDLMEAFALGRRSLAQARAEVDRLASLPKTERGPDKVRQAVQQIVAVAPTLSPAITGLAREAQHALPELADAVNGARIAAELREHAGQLGTMLVPALAAQHPFSEAERDNIERLRGRIDELLVLLDLHLQAVPASSAVARARRLVDEHYLAQGGALIERVVAAGRQDGHFGIDPATFGASYVAPINSIFALRDALLDEARALTRRDRAEARDALLAMAAGSAASLLLLGSAMGVIHRRVLRPLSRTATALQVMARGDLDIDLPPPQSRDEMSAVIGAVHDLHRYAQERQQMEAERAALIERLRELSNTDSLTGLLNRRAFLDAARPELARARRHAFELSVVLLDIDHFKQVNDRHGHAAGDAAIQSVAETMRQSLRAGDLAARFGGEEFVVLLSHCAANDAAAYAERLRQDIARKPLTMASGLTVSLSVSIGVASTTGFDTDLEATLAAADAAMYAAKQAGRNRVCIASPPVSA
jgi:diguanylate cyclase (GGDEF)-like protein